MTMTLDVQNITKDIRDNLRILREGLGVHKPDFVGSPFNLEHYAQIKSNLEALIRMTPIDCFPSTVELYSNGAMNVFFKRVGADHVHMLGRYRP